MGNKRLTETQSGVGAIEVECISNFNEVKKAKDRWDSLLEKIGINVPYLTFQWFCSALETIDRDKSPLLIFFKTHGEDIGLAPLVVKESLFLSVKYWVISFVQNPYTPYQRVIYDRDDYIILDALLNFLKKRFGTRFILDLDEVRLTEAEEKAVLKTATENLFLVHREAKSGSRYLILKNNFKETVSSLKKKTQKEFRRKIKRLSRLGTVTLNLIRGKDKIDQNLSRFFILYARTWKGAEPHPEFYYKLCTRFDQQGNLYFYSLDIDGEPIAYLICIAGNNVMYGIKTTYDPSYYAFSPGVVLFYKAIQDMFNVPGIEEFDIGRGHEQFKREWTSRVYHHSRLIFYPHALHWRILNYARYNMIPKIRKNREFDKLYSMLRNRLTLRGQCNTCDPGKQKQATKRFINCSEYADLEIPHPYTVRFASKDDLDKLVVVMAARNLAGIQRRLKGEKCILILSHNRALAYFWIPPGGGVATGEQGQVAFQNVVINEWGVSYDAKKEIPLEQLIQILARFILDTFPGATSITLEHAPTSREFSSS